MSKCERCGAGWVCFTVNKPKAGIVYQTEVVCFDEREPDRITIDRGPHKGVYIRDYCRKGVGEYLEAAADVRRLRGERNGLREANGRQAAMILEKEQEIANLEDMNDRQQKVLEQHKKAREHAVSEYRVLKDDAMALAGAIFDARRAFHDSQGDG